MINKNPKKAILSMILSCFFFSVLGGLIKFLGDDIHGFVQAFYRNFFSIFLLLPFLIYNVGLKIKTNRPGLLFLRSLFGSITMVLIFVAYTVAPISQVVAISFSTPLFIFLGGIIFFKEETNKTKNFFLVLGFLFVMLAIRPGVTMNIGSVLALCASFFHALAGLLVKELAKSEKIITLMFFMVLYMTIITFFPASPQILNVVDNKLWLGLFSLAIVGTLGNFFWTYAIAKTNVTDVMPFDFTKLIFAILIGAIFFSEKLDYWTMIGGLGIVLCNVFLYRLKN